MQDQNTSVVAEQGRPESKRDRVRRLFIGPFRQTGCGSSTARPRKNRKTDFPGWLRIWSISRLKTLNACGFACRARGTVQRRFFRPRRISYLGWAEAAQPRPIEDYPGFKSWLASAAGVEAGTVPGRLVTEYEFTCRHKHPPYHAAQKVMVAARSKEFAERLYRLGDKERTGSLSDHGDKDWLSRYRARDAMLRSWIRGSGATA